MKNPGELVRAQKISQDGWQDTDKAPDRDRIAKLFAVFRTWFPTFDADGPMVQMWAQETTGLTDGQFRSGLQRLKAEGMQYAPSLAKWYELCTRMEAPRYLGANPINMTEQRVSGLLTHEPRIQDREAYERQLKEMKEACQ